MVNRPFVKRKVVRRGPQNRLILKVLQLLSIPTWRRRNAKKNYKDKAFDKCFKHTGIVIPSLLRLARELSEGLRPLFGGRKLADGPRTRSNHDKYGSGRRIWKIVPVLPCERG